METKIDKTLLNILNDCAMKLCSSGISLKAYHGPIQKFNAPNLNKRVYPDNIIPHMFADYWYRIKYKSPEIPNSPVKSGKILNPKTQCYIWEEYYENRHPSGIVIDTINLIGG